MNRRIYRAKGTYIPTGKTSYLTNVWRRSKDEAEEDKKIMGDRFKNVNIESKDWIDFVNSRSKLKHPLPRY